MYIRGKGELWYYDELGNFIMSVLCCRGVRQGCVLKTTIMCVTVRPIYDALLVILGPEGFLFSFADDVYMGGVPWNVALALDATSGLYICHDRAIHGMGPPQNGSANSC
jgi:hypothetical protein